MPAIDKAADLRLIHRIKGYDSPIRPADHMGYALRQVSGRTGGAGEAGC
jgi:hypothetical protein